MYPDARTAEVLISQTALGRLSGWYSRNIAPDKPPAYVNVAMTVSASPTAELNPFVKVSDQPTLWTYQGDIPVLIKCITGLSLFFRNMTQEIYGDFKGTVAFKYAINVDDRIIGPDGREFKVVSVKSSVAMTSKSLELKYLP